MRSIDGDVPLEDMRTVHDNIRSDELIMRLAAAPARIRAMVMRELIWILSVGLGVGIPIALAATRVIESRLFRRTRKRSDDPALRNIITIPNRRGRRLLASPASLQSRPPGRLAL